MLYRSDHIKRQASTLLISAIMLVWAVVSAQAATYYVSTNGNNSWSGTRWATAKLTVEAGVALATVDGDEVIIGNGVYAHNSGGGITVNKAIWIHSAANDRDTVDVQGAYLRRVFNLNTNALVSGLSLSNGN